MKIKEITFISVFIGIVRLSSSIWSTCVQNPIDLVFVVDGSGSVGPNRFGLIKELAQMLIPQLNVGGENGTKVAFLQFSDSEQTRFEFGINDYSNVSGMVEAIEKVKYQYGKLQKTGFAMRMVETKVFNGEPASDRPWAQNVVVLIAEGPSTHPINNAIQEATHLKHSGTRLITIGVGRRITSQEFQDELYSLASSPQDVFFTPDDDILDLVAHVDGRLCPNNTAFLPVPSSTQVTKLSATPAFIPAQVVTSVLVKTMTIWMTSYVSVNAPVVCKITVNGKTTSTVAAAATSSSVEMRPTTSIVKLVTVPTPPTVTTGKMKETKKPPKKTKKPPKKTKKPPKTFSGKLLECFACNYNEDVAKDFSINCDRQKCARDEVYCADAVLEHAGKKFVRKKCATSQFCNSTAEQCVGDFQHTADYTDCSVTCCGKKFCNPYSRASYVTASGYIKYLLAFGILPLVTFIVDNR